MSIIKPDNRVGFSLPRASAPRHKLIVWNMALLVTLVLSLGLVAAQIDPGQMTAWVSTLVPASPAFAQEETIRGVTEQLSTPALIAAMLDPDPGVRISAAQALGWRRAAEGTDALLKATYDPDAHVQEEAAAALGDIGQIQALPRLQALQVVQGNSNVQLAAFEAEDQLIGRVAAALKVPRSAVQALAVAPNGVAYAAVSDDLYVLSDGAWQRMGYLPASPNELTLGPDGQTIYLATDSPGLYRSKNGGKIWEHGTFDQNSPTPWTVTAAVINPGNPQEIYIALASIGAENGQEDSLGIFASRDGGTTWQPVSKSPDWAVTRKLILDPATPGFLYGLTDAAPYRLALTGDAMEFMSN